MILYKRKVRFSKFLNGDYLIIGVGSDHESSTTSSVETTNWGASIQKTPLDDGELEVKTKLKFDRDTNAIMIFATTDVAHITPANKSATLTPVWSFCMGDDTPLECSVQCANGPICIFMVTTLNKAFVFETTKCWDANVSQLGVKTDGNKLMRCVRGDLIRYKDTKYNISSYWAMVADNLGHLSIFRGNVELDTKEPSNTVEWTNDVVIQDDDHSEEVLAVCGFRNAKEKTNYFYVLKKTCIFIYMRPAGKSNVWGLWDIIATKTQFHSMQMSEKFDRLFVMHEKEDPDDSELSPYVLSMLDPYDTETQKLTRTNGFSDAVNWTLNANQTKLAVVNGYSSPSLKIDMIYSTPDGLVTAYFDTDEGVFKDNHIFNTIKYKKDDIISFVSKDDRVCGVSTIATTSVLSARGGKVMLSNSTKMDVRLTCLIIIWVMMLVGYFIFKLGSRNQQ